MLRAIGTLIECKDMVGQPHVMDQAGEIVDIVLKQPESFEAQMLDYSERFGYLQE